MRQPEEEPSHECYIDYCLVMCENCGCDMCLEDEEIKDRWMNDDRICDKCRT